MKFSRLFAVGTLVLAAFAMGCSSSSEADPTPSAEEGEGNLKITLHGETYSRAAGPADYSVESAVKKFTVYVFNAENDALEATETFTGVTHATMSGISTGFPKKVIVIANAPGTFPVFNEGDDISKLQQAASGINLTYQSPANVATNGMVMMGEDGPVIMQLTGSTNVSITLRRLAAKVALGTINILPVGDYDIDEFEITGVSIQRAVSSTDIYGNALTSSTLFGGVVGSMSLTPQGFLYDAINETFEEAQEKTLGNYFYVLPNQDRDKATLLTLHSTYNGDQQYFPIPINTEIGDDNTDGTLILGNKSYIVNIIINNLGEGTTDPDIPPTEASITVDVEVAPWDNDIEQKVIW